jgi:hypothetical protein
MRNLIALAIVIGAGVFGGAGLAATTVEADTDRWGSDYSGTDLGAADPELCRAACEADAACKAYTYVKPGVQGPNARCYLKNSVPAPSANACCVSGVKTAPAARAGSPPVVATPRAPAPPPPPDPNPPSAGSPTVVAPIPGGVLEKLWTKPKDPGPLGRGSANGSLNGKDPNKSPSCKDPTKNAIVAVLSKLADWFGGAVSYDAHCGTYERELTAGVTLAAPQPPPGQNPAWPQLGGAGDLMSDAMLCLAKDIGEAPGGKIVRDGAKVGVGGAEIAIEQTVGLAKFDAGKRRAELYHQVRLCAPILGCMDAQRQQIAAEQRKSIPAWPGGMKSGHYPVGDSHSLHLAADWANSSFGAKTPPITIPTPYATATVQPEFALTSSLYPVDTPFNSKGGSLLYMKHPDARSPDKPLADDTYGRSGLPLMLSIITAHKAPEADCPNQPEGFICLPPPDPNPPPSGWSSQLLFGARNGTSAAGYWNPGGAKHPERFDLDLDQARSALERGPTANFTAKSPVTIAPSIQEILQYIPPGVKDLIGDIGLTITVTPEFAADFAAQLGFIEREGRIFDCWPKGPEFGGPCAQSEALLYAQTRAEASFKLYTTLRLWIDFTFDMPFYDPDIDETFGPLVVPIGGGKDWDPQKPAADPYASVARASILSTTPGKPVAQRVKGLSGATHGDIRQWADQCLKTPPKAVSKLPEPTHEPGSADDLLPGYLPCNICVADSKQTKYGPFVFPKVTEKLYSSSKSWTCAWEENLGCYDLCSWHKGISGKAVFDAAVISAVDAVGARCKEPKPPEIK